MLNQTGMNPPAAGRDDNESILLQVHRGMRVIDRNNKAIGTVDAVYFGETSEQVDNRGLGAATARDLNQPGESPLRDAGKMFEPDDIPQELRERLLREGFLKMDTAGLLASDRYVLPDQIDHVTGDQVMLRVTRDDLIKK